MNAMNASPLVRMLVGGVCAGIVAGCAPTLLPLGVDIGKISGKISAKNEPISAALVIPGKVKNATTTLDVTCGGTYTVPVGIELTEGMLHGLSQVFDSVRLVDAKPAQSGEYDFVIEPALPELTVDGQNCYIRRGLWVVFPVKLFYNPVDQFEAQTTMRVSVEDRTGKIIMNKTFSSQRHNRDNNFGNADVVPIAGALQSSFVDAIQRITLGVAETAEYRTYARKERKSPDQSQPAEAVVVSDVDNAPQVSLPAQKNRFAVLIGIEQYRQQLPKVEFASHDAQIMREYLVKTLGYPEENVVTLLNQNATKTDIEKYIERWLPNHVDKNSSVFVFYSGHGAPNAKTNESYLVPYDGDPTFLEVTGYSLKRLYEQLGQLVSEENFVVLDSCFSGSGGRSVVAKGTRPIVIMTESPALLSGKTVVLSASAGNQVSNTYSPMGHGLLTYFFLKGLRGEADKNQDKIIDVQELFAYIKPSVEGTARREYNNEQTPQLIGGTSVLRRLNLIGQPMP
jgi:hypothetical protein